MSEKEKNAIETIYIFNLAKNIIEISNDEFLDVKNANEILLNLIKKLQKENEDLKEAYDNCFGVASETRRDLINQLADCQEYIDYINNEEMDNLWEENLNM